MCYKYTTKTENVVIPAGFKRESIALNGLDTRFCGYEIIFVVYYDICYF